jgi:hypothetical protein
MSFAVFKSMRTSSIRKRSALRYLSSVSVSFFEVPLDYIERHVTIIFVIVPAFALKLELERLSLKRFETTT